MSSGATGIRGVVSGMSRTVADTKEQAKNKRLAADENGMLELGTLGAAGESRILWKKKTGLYG